MCGKKTLRTRTDPKYSVNTWLSGRPVWLENHRKIERKSQTQGRAFWKGGFQGWKRWEWDGNERARLGCGQVRGKWVELEEPPGVELSRTWDNSSVMFAALPPYFTDHVYTAVCVPLRGVAVPLHVFEAVVNFLQLSKASVNLINRTSNHALLMNYWAGTAELGDRDLIREGESNNTSCSQHHFGSSRDFTCKGEGAVCWAAFSLLCTPSFSQHIDVPLAHQFIPNYPSCHNLCGCISLH